MLAPAQPPLGLTGPRFPLPAPEHRAAPTRRSPRRPLAFLPTQQNVSGS